MNATLAYMRLHVVFCVAALLILVSCSAQPVSHERTDVAVPALSTAQVTTREVSFYSAALQRRMRYRIVLPAGYLSKQDHRYPTLYLLHGHPGDLTDWTAKSRLLDYLKSTDLIVVLPQADESYYVNAAQDPAGRYEDYITHDMLEDVDSHFPTAALREARGIGGLSIGGYGAFTLLLKHSDVFSYAAVMSGSLEVTERRFGYDGWHNWWARRKALGPLGSAACAKNDAFQVLAAHAATLKKSHVLLTCGASDRLVEVNRKMALALTEQRIQYEYIEKPGDHNWEFWDGELPTVIAGARARLGPEAVRMQ